MLEDTTNFHVTGGQQNTTSYVLDTNRTANCVDQACALWSTREIYLRSAVVTVSRRRGQLSRYLRLFITRFQCPLPLPLVRAWFTASGMFCKYGSSPSSSSFTTYLAILSFVFSNLHLQKYSTNSGSLCFGDSNLCQSSVRTCTLLSNSSLE